MTQDQQSKRLTDKDYHDLNITGESDMTQDKKHKSIQDPRQTQARSPAGSIMDLETMSRLERVRSKIGQSDRIISEHLSSLSGIIAELRDQVIRDYPEDFREIQEITKRLETLDSRVLGLFHESGDLIIELTDLISRLKRETGHIDNFNLSPEDLESLGLFDPEKIQKEIDSESGPEESEVRPDSSLKYDPYYDPSLWETGPEETKETGPDNVIEVKISDSGQLMPDLRKLTPEERKSYLEIFSGLDSETDSESE